MSMAVAYHPLHAGEIRLLSFLDDHGLTCELKSYTEDEAPPYIALSYTWKLTRAQQPPQSSSWWITLNNQQVEVQQNLHDALRHLGHAVRARQSLFWVDAICINQSDSDEKSIQVQRMKSIYESASMIFA